MERFQQPITNEATGVPLAGVRFYVQNYPAATPAVIYGVNDNTSTPLVQPLITQANGTYPFYAADGHYQIVSNPPGGQPIITDFLLQDLTQASSINVAAQIVSVASKTTPANADLFALADSANGFGLKQFSWGNLVSIVTGWYSASSGSSLIGDNTGGGLWSTLKGFITYILSSAGAAIVGYLPAGTGAVATTLQNKERESPSVFDFMTPAQVSDVVAGTASIDLTTAFVTAISAIPTNGSMRFPYGTYLGVLSVRRSNITLIFEGCTIQHPAGATSNVLELGDTASGNGATAYERIHIQGNVLLDGNKANVTAPSGDITGWGFCATKISNSDWGTGIRAKNCHNGGFGVFINSNYNKASVYVESCGNATYTNPGFDINSSKYSTYDVISKDCYAGARVLDNCFGINLRASIYNATKDGFEYNNQSVNASYANNIDVAVYTCGQHGLNIGENCSNSNIRATIYNATGKGCIIGDATGHPSSNNNIDLVTYNSGASGLLINSDGNDNIIRYQSNFDGRTGAQGASFAVDISGNRNKLIIDLIDSSTWQVRGIAMRAAALDNEILSYSYRYTADPYNDGAANTRTKFNHGQGRGVDIASATTITIPLMGTIFHITGTNGIATMAGASKDEAIMLIFDSTPTVTKGSNLKLGAGGNFVATQYSTLSGIWDGTNFYETGRSVV